MPIVTEGYAATDTTGHLTPIKYELRDLGENDVHIKIVACGICHSDIHMVKCDWGSDWLSHPIVPGHEIAGIVEAVGSAVCKFKKGDRVGAGLFVNSCQKCELCLNGEENYCPSRVFSFNHFNFDGSKTYGGYAKDYVCHEKFICKYPDGLDMLKTAPLLCAGISVYAPMMKHGMDKIGKKIGVVGLGGLGHMAVKFGVAFGNEVTVISTSESKRKEAIETLGATNFINFNNADELKSLETSLDFIVDTLSAVDMDKYINLLKFRGVLVVTGLPNRKNKMQISPVLLVDYGRTLAGSCVGSMREMEKMLEFCASKNISPLTEIVPMSKVNEAFERVIKADVHYRFVIDIQNTF